ncbi:uncharacterized protein CEXT_236741 [Caerostris extrusa]|uniref:Uncharacterized protein n=1 Tax=Caerostris extrusa TaxID=172846 RepID=A0AAV4Q0T5_CAEEX|nr:uncharacterized protein CEXT_236741 [Caerostris extrusa]
MDIEGSWRMRQCVCEQKDEYCKTEVEHASVDIDNQCADKCLAGCEGDCQITDYSQLNPCSYQCNINGQYYYGTEEDFSYCGTNKVCYKGSCLSTIYTDRCQYLYGGDYIAIQERYESCSYHCVSTTGCGTMFLENLPQETSCSAGYSGLIGDSLTALAKIGTFTGLDSLARVLTDTDV